MENPLTLRPSLLDPKGLDPRGEGENLLYFPDLLLDELEVSLFASHPGLDLEAFFRAPLGHKDAVLHRQEVARDLEAQPLARAFRAFFQAMEALRKRLGLAKEARHPWQRRLYFLQGVEAYLEAFRALEEGFARHPPGSAGLRGYRDYLEICQKNPDLIRLLRDLREVRSALAALRYTLHVHEGRLALRAYGGEPDYGERVVETFRPFFGPNLPAWQEPALPPGPWLNHVEEWILDHLARLFPKAFALLEAFVRSHPGFVDPFLVRLEQEARFFLAYLDFIAPMREAGLLFTYPEIAEDPPFFAERAFDLVLAAKLLGQGKRPVENSFRFDRATILVVSGPNQGGKTTFARMVGQVHHLAALGLPVPGAQARLSLPDRILTHFEVRENPEELRSKLEEDLHRLRVLLERATERSLLILNEPFASAALTDARLIGRFVLERIRAKGCRAVVVTFLDELARLPGAKSLVAEVDPLDPARRTFRVQEKPAVGRAYALALAEKYRLTYPLLSERLKRRSGGGP